MPAIACIVRRLARCENLGMVVVARITSPVLPEPAGHRECRPKRKPSGVVYFKTRALRALRGTGDLTCTPDNAVFAYRFVYPGRRAVVFRVRVVSVARRVDGLRRTRGRGHDLLVEVPDAVVVGPDALFSAAGRLLASPEAPPHRHLRRLALQLGNLYPDERLAGDVPRVHVVVKHFVAADERDGLAVHARVLVEEAWQRLLRDPNQKREVLERRRAGIVRNREFDGVGE